MKKQYLCLLFISLLQISGLHSKTAHASESNFPIVHKQIKIRAYSNKKDKTLLFYETHTSYFKGPKLLRSDNFTYSPSGEKIAQMISNYQRNIKLPEYTFEDFRFGIKEGLRFKNNKYYIFHSDKDSKEQIQELKNPDQAIAGQGLHYYILQNFNFFLQQELKFNLVLPTELDYFRFKIRRVQDSNEILTLRVESSNWFVRLFAPHFDMNYHIQNKEIHSYLGPSNILDDNQKLQYVYMIYEDQSK